ncbi:hypothetical protein OHA19_18425 [Streptomyces sp. NBC_00012]|uniref:Uncharacterized protein n=1 Tax=Streptomyces gelaticus TaxID=285446 RepID=A0ABQ2W3I0_9ACTN|nr:hypothetical protein [Streptomyces gelaticus]GGV90233.1 hypothetical protein GCM10015535_45850 [Streptomyces gelaticus]
MRVGEHVAGQSRLGGECRLVGHPGQFTAFVVAGPRLTEIEAAVDQRVALRAHVGEMYRDLAQSDPAQGSGVLAAGADRVEGRLLIARLVHHQHHLPVAELLHRPGRGRPAYRLGIEAGPGQEVLQDVRAGVADRLGQ